MQHDFLQSARRTWASQVVLVVKNPTANARDIRDVGLILGKIHWSGAWPSTPVFLPRESHGQRNLVGYSQWDHKESDMTKATQHACTGELNYVLNSLSEASLVNDMGI